ncbi:rubrerythrin [uncultured Clostridium sp.]|jgi:rubrerythrin|uniref:rubrerythrin n=1 Tax=uncultured Clostridium sp. TaxID=59620 RepID=UPI0026322A0A|nr:rubrerythrin family protein [uncultured Clostridium sp.]
MGKLNGTKTAENLMKSFAGESQARNRYTFYSVVAKQEGYEEIAKVFEETADQERAHANVFYKFLAADLNGEKVVIDADYPVELHKDTLSNLKAAVAGEHEETEVLYPEFAKVADTEGFAKVAEAYRAIGKIEKMHEERYKRFHASVEQGDVYKKGADTFWICQNCGYIVEGAEPPKICPVCYYSQAYFKVYTDTFK